MGDSIEKKEEKTETQTEKKETEKKEYTKEQQALDQERANLKREKEEKERILAEKEDLESQLLGIADEFEASKQESANIKAEIAVLKEQIAKTQTKAGVDEEDDLESSVVDPKVIKHIKLLKNEKSKLEQQLSAVANDIKELQTAKAKFEQDSAERLRFDEKERRKEAILKDCDEEFGAKYRNDAIELANKKVREVGTAPEGEYAVAKLLRQCYKETADQEKKEPEKKSVTVDSGTKSVSQKEDEIQDGDYKTVVNQWRKKWMAKGISAPST